MSITDCPPGNFRFRVRWLGRSVACFAEVSPLPEKSTGVGSFKTGSSRPGIGPEGQGTPYFISLDRGVAFDLGFEQWISMVRSFGPATGKGSLLPEYKRPLTIEVYDGNGEMEYAYHLSSCWVTEYRAVPDPDTASSMVTITHLKLGFGTWARDPPVRG